MHPWLPRLAFAPRHTAPRGDVLVCVFLRGGADALNMVVPHGEQAYYRLRPALAIARPDDQHTPARLRSQDLDGFFGLHPALAALLPVWQAQQFAVVHACGAPDESRSHFQAMDLMERGVTAVAGPASGWIGRHLGSLEGANRSPLRAVAAGERAARLLQGPVPVAALQSIADYHLGSDPAAVARMQAALTRLYTGDERLAAAAISALEALHALSRLDLAGYRPAAEARYPVTGFGAGLRQVAMLVKAEVGLEVACLDLGGWDTHVAQGGSEGLQASLLADLGDGLAALLADLADRLDRLVVVVLSEFGRRASENAAAGTDHGHGGVLLLLGGGVRGGQVYGHWPGLEPEQLVGPGDLAVTVDYRDILAEVVQCRLHNPHLDMVFPGHTPVFQRVVR